MARKSLKKTHSLAISGVRRLYLGLRPNKASILVAASCFVVVTSLVILKSRDLAVASIDLYQRNISPYKGYHCAYAQLHRGELSCSGYGRQAILDNGLLTGIKLLDRRFEFCGAAADILAKSNSNDDCGQCCESKPRHQPGCWDMIFGHKCGRQLEKATGCCQ